MQKVNKKISKKISIFIIKRTVEKIDKKLEKIVAVTSKYKR